jgi:predicted transcriptional regulator
MKARDVMSTPVISLRAQVPAHVAAALLVSNGFTAAPVVDDDDRVIGIATEADLVRGRIAAEGSESAEERPEPTVADVMTEAPVVGRSDDDLADVVTMMLDSKIRSVPIVDDDRLVGVVSRRDVLRLVSHGTLTSEDVWRRRVEMASHSRGTS